MAVRADPPLCNGQAHKGRDGDNDSDDIKTVQNTSHVKLLGEGEIMCTKILAICVPEGGQFHQPLDLLMFRRFSIAWCAKNRVSNCSVLDKKLYIGNINSYVGSFVTNRGSDVLGVPIYDPSHGLQAEPAEPVSMGAFNRVLRTWNVNKATHASK